MDNRFVLTPYFLDEERPRLTDIAKAGWHINQPHLPEGKTMARLCALYDPLANQVAQALRAGQRAVSIVNDCCASLGMLAGLQRAGVDASLVWFDAHGDFNTWETTPSGFLGGMPLAWIVGLGEQTVVDGISANALSPARVILTDARDLDPGAREAVADSGISHLKSVGDILDHALPDGPLWVHFDVDVIDPQVLPAVGYPAPGGPAAGHVRAAFQHIAATGRVQAVSVSSWNPQMDHNGQSRALTLSLLGELLG